MASVDLFGYSSPTGHVFSPSERVALATSLPLLASRTKRRHLCIWGKILGYKADYIIVQAFDDDLVAEPELYYTVDEGLTFTLLGTTSSVLGALPSMNGDRVEQQALKQSLVRRMRGPFLGDPSYEYRIPSDVTGEVTSYKESVRLALFVEEHDYHCRVAPRGAYYRAERNDTLPSEIRTNAAFAGLPRSQDGALAMRNYYHIRAPNPYRRFLATTQNVLFEKSSLEKLSENPHLDAAFDPITDDVPTGIWRLRYDPAMNVVVGSNALFPGSIFYHVPEKSQYGTVYIGDGNMNQNVGFEL